MYEEGVTLTISCDINKKASSINLKSTDFKECKSKVNDWFHFPQIWCLSWRIYETRRKLANSLRFALSSFFKAWVHVISVITKPPFSKGGTKRRQHWEKQHTAFLFIAKAGHYKPFHRWCYKRFGSQLLFLFKSDEIALSYFFWWE